MFIKQSIKGPAELFDIDIQYVFRDIVSIVRYGTARAGRMHARTHARGIRGKAA